MSATALSVRMRELLLKLPEGERVDLFRHSWGTAKALAARGLCVVQWIGMGHFRCQITTAGVRARGEQVAA